jgi:long-chain fatty acid transport protein
MYRSISYLKMKMNTKSPLAGFVALVSLVAVLAVPHSARALGFLLPDQDAYATSRGNAFVATADDPAAVYYNPAGIAQLDSGFSLGAYGITYGSTYKGFAGEIQSKTQLQVVPQVFSILKLPYGITFGMGTYSPFGLRYEWPATAPFVARGETGEIDFVTLNPVLGFKILPSLSVAAGPTLNFSEADFKEYIAPFNLINHFRGRDTSAGYNFGVLWQPWIQHSFGVTYRSSSDMNYNGHATSLTGPGNIPSQANIKLPQSVAFGYSYRPTTNWNIEGDADWTDWTGLRTVGIAPQAGLGDDLSFNWHPSWIFSLGATRNLGNGWRVSGGYMYSMNSVPQADFNALVPDGDRHLFSVGVGKQYTKFSWEVAYQLGIGLDRTISSDNFAPANGTYNFLSHAISLNFGYRF